MENKVIKLYIYINFIIYEEGITPYMQDYLNIVYRKFKDEIKWNKQ